MATITIIKEEQRLFKQLIFGRNSNFNGNKGVLKYEGSLSSNWVQ